MTPYEIHDGKIGVQARYLIESNKVVSAAAESLMLMKYDALDYKITQGYLKKLRPHGPGQPMLLDWQPIPEAHKRLLIKAFGEPEKVAMKRDFVRLYKRDLVALEFYMAYRRRDGSGLRCELIDEYTLNASVLNTMNAYYRFISDQRRNLKISNAQYKEQNTGIVKLSTFEICVNEVNRYRDTEPHTLPASVDRLRKTIQEYKRDGYAAIVSGKIDNANSLKVTDPVVEVLNSLFAGVATKPNYTEVSRVYDAFKLGYSEVINNETGQLYLADEFPNICPGTVRRWLSKWENRVGNEMKRPNNRQRMIARFRPYHSLEQPKYSGSIISIDDRDMPFLYGDGKRLMWYLGIDLGSECWTTWVYGESKDAAMLLDFYRTMIRNYHAWGVNIPAELEGEMHLNSSLLETVLKEGVMFEYTHIEANNARGKRIERYIGGLRNIEREEYGWISRPFAKRESEQGDDRAKPIYRIKQDLIDMGLQTFEKWNNEPHSLIQGMTRWEVFKEMQHKNLMPTNYRAFLPLIGYCTKTSCRTGIIQLNNREYLLGENGKVTLGHRLIELLKQAEGEKVTIYWMDDNEGDIILAHVYVAGNYICEAVAKPIYQRAQIERTVADAEARQTMSSYVSTVDKFMKDQKNAIQEVTVIEKPREASKAKHVFTTNFQSNKPRRQEYNLNSDDVEILPDNNEGMNELMIVETADKRSLKDRF